MSLANKNTAGPTPEIDDRINPANRPLILLAPDGEIHAFVLNPHLLSGVDPTQMRPGTRSSAAGELQILTNHLLMQNGFTQAPRPMPVNRLSRPQSMADAEIANLDGLGDRPFAELVYTGPGTEDSAYGAWAVPEPMPATEANQPFLQWEANIGAQVYGAAQLIKMQSGAEMQTPATAPAPPAAY